MTLLVHAHDPDEKKTKRYCQLNLKNGQMKKERIIEISGNPQLYLKVFRGKDMIRNVFFSKKGSAVENFFKDLIDREDTILYEGNVPLKNKALNLIRTVHTSQTIRRHVELPFQSIWFDMKPLAAISPASDFIFTNEALAFLDISDLKKIHQNFPQGRMILILVDSMHAKSRNMISAMPLIRKFPWDLVMSFNPEDCREFGFRDLRMKYYSVLTDTLASENTTSDLCFAGGAQPGDTRVPLIRTIYQTLKKKGIKEDFLITNWPDQHDGIRYEREYIPYRSILEMEKQSNCILEILKEGQHFQTVRYFEAVVYQKKLLTNNPNLSELPYYNSEFMKYFSEPSDIDPEWIRKQEPVHYDYDNQFSPEGIPDLIEEYLSENKQRGAR